MNKFFLVVARCGPEMDYGGYVFGPRSTRKEIIELQNKVGKGMIVRLPTGNLEDAVVMLQEGEN